ncbi:MAG: hypothetical protein HQL16_03275 [Candidatus Omnitrophica bacterium]|nr:hypothetical protein [Candidatus Omnitrophota bacterium]
MLPAIPIFIFLVINGIVIFMFWKRMAQVKGVLNSCGGRSTGLGGGVINVNGRDVGFYYQESSRNSPSLLRLSLKGNFFAHAAFHHETSADKAVKSAGVNQEIQLYDPPVDDELYIECEDQGFVSRFFSSSDTKVFLVGLLRNFTRLEINGSSVTLTKTPCESLSGIDSEEIRQAAEKLCFIADQIPLPAPGERSATPATDDWKMSEGLFTGIGIASLVFGVVLLIWGVAAFEPIDKGKLFAVSLNFSVPFFGLFAFFAFQQLKGHSTSAKTLLIAGLTAGVGFILCGWSGGVVLNGTGDISKAKTHESIVINKYISHGKHSTYYHLTVAPLDRSFDNYTLDVSRCAYDQTQLSSRLNIITRDGAFGFKWVVK